MPSFLQNIMNQAFNALDIRGMQINDTLPEDAYYAALPVISKIRRDGGLELTKPITFFVGEHGTGKSTLIEAIAVAAGFNPEGGTRNYAFRTADSYSSLHNHIRLVRGIRRHTDGYFLRAESFYNAASYLDTLDPDVLLSYGGRSLHEMSHGESFLALVENRFSEDGLFILDEPEAALSPRRILRLMVSVHSLAERGAQFIISTHSPLLVTLPDADILQFSDRGFERAAFEETDSFRITKDFVMNPDRMLRVLFGEE